MTKATRPARKTSSHWPQARARQNCHWHREDLAAVKLHDYFAGLLDGTVNVNDDRLRQLDDHVAAIRDCLREDEDLAPKVRRFVPQGSWAQRTIIKPLPGHEFDADVLVEMKQQRKWADDPKRYLLAVHNTLSASARYRSRAELKTRCVRVVYAGDCHIDLVPYVHTSGWFERHEIVNRADNRFEEVNPSGFADWMRGRDRLAAGNLRKTIRLLKYLRDYKQTFTVPSVILTVIVGSRVGWWRSQLLDGYADLPTTFTRLVTDTDRWLQERPDLPEISDPSCPQARFDHRLTQHGYGNFRDRFHGYADKIRAAYDAEERDESVALWRKVFGDEFAPRP
jgi:Second Messenger Oligonucleotide or Dinucleotide Synthetase domain